MFHEKQLRCFFILENSWAMNAKSTLAFWTNLCVLTVLLVGLDNVFLMKSIIPKGTKYCYQNNRKV